MATIKDVKTQIENANALGVANLNEKGVIIPNTSTTYEIMQSIAKISGGGGDIVIGADCTNIVYNNDDTITLTDKDGTTHTLVCTYESGKLVGVTYDGRKIDLLYDSAWLDKVGKTDVDLEKIPSLDYTVKFIVEGKPYKIVDLTDGLSVEKPSIDPPNMGEYRFNGWKIDGEYMEFPCVPEKDMVFNAYFQKVREEMELYDALSFLAEDKNGDARWKANDGWSIAGYIPTDGHGYIMLVAKTPEACHINYEYVVHSGSIEYGNVTYYYCYAGVSFGAVKLCNNVEIEPMSYVDSSNHQLAAKKVLDKYFYVT